MMISTSTSTSTSTSSSSSGTIIVGQDGVRDRLHLREFEGLVERALRHGRRLIEAEAQRTGAVIRRIQQVLHLAGLRLAEMALDHATAPIVGTGIAPRAKYAAQRGRRTGARGMLQLHGIKRDGVRALQ